MRRFQIDNAVFDLFPELSIGIVVCTNICNEVRHPDQIEALLRDAEREALQKLEGEEISQSPYIKVWRDAMKHIKAKKGHLSSIESFAKRVIKDEPLWSINPLVDIYNSVSISNLIPCGGEDLDRLCGDMILTRAKGNEHFVPLGEEAEKPPLPGEVIYHDDEGAVVRDWLWREADRTKITEKTTNALLYMECLDKNRVEEHQKSIEILAERVSVYLGGEYCIHFLDRAQSSVELE